MIYIIFLLLIIFLYFLIEENYNSCSIVTCSSTSTKSIPNGNNCCTNINGAISYADTTCIPKCNITNNYYLSNNTCVLCTGTLSYDNINCCKNIMGVQSYNSDCTIKTYITEDTTKVRLYGKENYIDLIGNFNVGNNIITDRLIFSAKIPSNYKVTFYNNDNITEKVTLTNNSSYYLWKNINKVDVLSNI